MILYTAYKQDQHWMYPDRSDKLSANGRQTEARVLRPVSVFKKPEKKTWNSLARIHTDSSDPGHSS